MTPKRRHAKLPTRAIRQHARNRHDFRLVQRRRIERRAHVQRTKQHFLKQRLNTQPRLLFQNASQQPKAEVGINQLLTGRAGANLRLTQQFGVRLALFQATVQYRQVTQPRRVAEQMPHGHARQRRVFFAVRQ